MAERENPFMKIGNCCPLIYFFSFNLLEIVVQTRIIYNGTTEYREAVRAMAFECVNFKRDTR